MQSVAGGNRRGGIGTEQQRVELGFERSEPCILDLELLGYVPELLGLIARFDRADLRIERWMPVKPRQQAPPGPQRGEEVRFAD